MKFGDMDICNLPLWMGHLVDEIQTKCTEALLESEQYEQLSKEGSELLETYRFISMLTDRDDILEPLHLSIEEAKALSRFLAVDGRVYTRTLF